ncbi:MAG: hypothetical protein II200_06195 [Bacteroidaceae bacterium]|nr:hypothetical protein [Bacteroidaceae bacterium]
MWRLSISLLRPCIWHKTKRDLADSFLEGTNTAHTITLNDLKDFVQ